MARNVIPAAAGEGRESLYERDYYTWTVEQARALKDHHVANLDWKNLAEEVEDLGKASAANFKIASKCCSRIY